MTFVGKAPLGPFEVVAFEDEGNDLALAADLDAMTPELRAASAGRAASEANWRAALEEARSQSFDPG